MSRSAVDVRIEPATLEYAAELGQRLRQADIDEVWASAQLTPAEALSRSIKMSTQAWAGFADGRLVVLWGVAPASLLGGIGVPWLLGSDDVVRYQWQFLRRCGVFRNKMLEDYAILRNWVDARNTVSIRWLKWLGFRLGPPQPWGPLGIPFHPFEMRRDDV